LHADLREIAMNRRFRHRPIWLLLAGLSLVSIPSLAGDTALPNMLRFPNPTGYAATFSTTGKVDLTGPFFQSLGTNGRSCGSCHQPSDGWTVTPKHIQQRFEATGGTDPIFRTVDGANAPELDVSTVRARRSAYSMLLSKGLIRVGIGMPTGPGVEFELVAVDDPYGHASAQDLSLFRRPLPATNLKFLSTVMWDGRETFKDVASQDCVIGTTNCYSTVAFDLADQANGATLGHAQGATPLSDEQRHAIVAFESALYTAQVFDVDAGELNASRAFGGPDYLSAQQSYFGDNDAIAGDYRTGAPFNSTVFHTYDAWARSQASEADEHSRVAARAAVVRGQAIFNTRLINITDVKGLNDDLNLKVIPGTCTTCHDTPNAGDHSVPAPLDIGIADASRRTPDLPLYTLRNLQTGETIQTTDPGRALLTGKWKDIGRFKGPVLRGLATRAPYFHNGFAADLAAVVDFYNTRFTLDLNDQEKSDLIAFLQTL
jgi:cytochrome c peroxidase